jgi:hypothetical protein
MNGTPLKILARDLSMPVGQLTAELKAIGVDIKSEDEQITGQQQLMLSLHLHNLSKAPEAISEVSLNTIKSATDLHKLNELLTRAMADRTIQALIKDSHLNAIIDHVLSLNSNPERELLTAAILGRLAAVARGREQSVFDRADEVVSNEPASIETLADGDAKQYAAQLLTHVTLTWVTEYAYREALTIDTADNARRELLTANLLREESISEWLNAISSHASILRRIENPETRLKRARRIFGVMSDVVERWRGEVGTDIGSRLAEFMKSLLSGKLADLDQDVLFDSMDSTLGILRRVIELRFSHALEGATYALLIQGKKLLGNSDWGRFVDSSSVIPEIRTALLEAALVRARQNRQYREVLICLMACYTSKAQVVSAIKRHFMDARDLDPDVAKWWLSAGGESEGQRHVEHKVGINEDSQIGALLIEVESNREAMDKVGRAVVPLLEISEPVLASTVKKAVDGYEAIAQTARRLARMRKLSKTDLKGARLEYNPLEHEMLGGHQAGVRRVKVLRDGIQKEFAGKTKTLVKPWVEPDEE